MASEGYRPAGLRKRETLSEGGAKLQFRGLGKLQFSPVFLQENAPLAPARSAIRHSRIEDLMRLAIGETLPAEDGGSGSAVGPGVTSAPVEQDNE